MLKSSRIATLRNAVITEAIEIENLIWSKLPWDDKNIIHKIFNHHIGFKRKIDLLFEYYTDDNLAKKLKKFKKERNSFAHHEEPMVNIDGEKKKIKNLNEDELEKILYDKLKEIDNLKTKIAKLKKKKKAQK